MKIVETDAIKAHDYSLAVNNYIEKKAQEIPVLGFIDLTMC